MCECDSVLSQEAGLGLVTQGFSTDELPLQSRKGWSLLSCLSRLDGLLLLPRYC